MFSIHTESGFPDVVVINAAWGLGETVVGGEITPDEFLVFKPLLAESGKKNTVPILARRRGSKEKKAVYAEEGPGEIRTVDTSDEERRSLTLADKDVLQLARWAVTIEEHYDRPMDLEWGRDGGTGALFILQARPDGTIAQGGGVAQDLHAEGAVRAACRRSGHWQRHRGGPGASPEKPGRRRPLRGR